MSSDSKEATGLGDIISSRRLEAIRIISDREGIDRFALCRKRFNKEPHELTDKQGAYFIYLLNQMRERSEA